MNDEPSPNLSPEALRRLLIGRQLLEGFGPELTTQSSPLDVARAILAAQDAAELIASAIAEHLQSQPEQRSSLLDYIASVEKKTATPFPGKAFFSNLNRARVAFKHYGSLPNVSEFHRAITRAQDHLEQACVDQLGVSLSELDLSLLIMSPDIRELYIRARDHAQNKEYQHSLEALARAMAELSREAPMYIPPGQTDSELALQLMAYGVDPGAFIRMQQFLPGLTIDEINWETRKYGHPGNWKQQNVEFCLATFVDLVLKLQHAQDHPQAIEFSFYYDDVLTAKHDGVEVRSQHYDAMMAFLSLGGQGEQTLFAILQQGQQIKGKVIPAVKPSRGGTWAEVELFEQASLFVVQSSTISTGQSVPKDTVLIVETRDVTWSYAESEAPGHRRRDLIEYG